MDRALALGSEVKGWPACVNALSAPDDIDSVMARPYANRTTGKDARSRLCRFTARVSQPLRRGIEKIRTVPRAAGQWLEDHHEEILEAVDKLERIARHLTSRFLPPQETAALTTAGWTPFGWSLEEIRVWGRLALTEGEDAVNAAICAAYRAENWARLEDLAQSMYAAPLLARRVHLIRDAVQAHKLGLHAATIPPLIAQLEGATRDEVDQAAAEVARVEADHDSDRLVSIAEAFPSADERPRQPAASRPSRARGLRRGSLPCASHRPLLALLPAGPADPTRVPPRDSPWRRFGLPERGAVSTTPAPP